MKTVIVDIDGVLTDYPNCFLHWVKHVKNMYFNSVKDMKKHLGIEEYEKIKMEYRSSHIKRTLDVNNGFINILNKLHADGFTIWILTTRPNIEPVSTDTVFWLNNNKIPYDAVFFIKDKKEFLQSSSHNNIMVLIDDELSNILE
jgi:uncharacterized HAD superfamily protein